LRFADRKLDYVEYFLNPLNHQPGIPLDYFSYHFYGKCKSRTDASTYVQFFSDADTFFLQAAQIQAIKNILSPHTKTYVDESSSKAFPTSPQLALNLITICLCFTVGVILPDDNVNNPQPIPALYWPAAGSMYAHQSIVKAWLRSSNSPFPNRFAYVFANLQKIGVEIIGESQLVGYPTQFPSVSMMDWTNGQPNAKYWTLTLLLQHFAPGDRLVYTTASTPKIFAQAYLTPSGRRILLINKKDSKQTVKIPGVIGATIQTIDETTGNSPASESTLDSETLIMNAFSTSVISL